VQNSEVSKMATHMSELTRWKARDMEQPVSRSSVWTTPSQRSQPASSKYLKHIYSVYLKELDRF
jgi:hypothetical protein